ncbi:uncharacterized protein [Chironomus tepperi]|uniref:uncharacterized protein n=1 Tax=Chironomus tepperi TaxID=113505 RepID=UPI00391F7884
MKLYFVFITFTCFFFTGSCKSSLEEILSNPKDDCGNKCGQLNINITDSKCGDPDKRQFKFLLIHDSHDRKEETADYYEHTDSECVDKCPADFKQRNFEDYFFCYKNDTAFTTAADNAVIKAEMMTIKYPRKDYKKEPNSDVGINKGDKVDYTWWIVGGFVAILIIILTIWIGFILCHKKRDNAEIANAPPASPNRRPVLL